MENMIMEILAFREKGGSYALLSLYSPSVHLLLWLVIGSRSVIVPICTC